MGDKIELSDIERKYTCLFVKNGIESGIFMGQRDLEMHLSGDRQLEQVDIGNLHLLKLALPTLKKVCEDDSMIRHDEFEEYEADIKKILKDMEDYAE